MRWEQTTKGKGMDRLAREDHRIMPSSESLLCSNFFWLLSHFLPSWSFSLFFLHGCHYFLRCFGVLQFPMQLINPS